MKLDLSNSYKVDTLPNVSDKEIKALNLFWIAFSIYTLCYLLKGSFNINIKIFELAQLTAVAVFVTKSIFLIKMDIKNGYLRITFFAYMLWLLYVISRGFRINFHFLKDQLINGDYGIFLYFAPLILLFPKNLIYYKKLCDAILLFGILYLVCSIFFFKKLVVRTVETKNTIEYLVNYLGMTCGFILLTFKYHSAKRNLLALSVMMLSVLFAIYKARRGLSSICLSILVAAYFLYLFHTKRKILVIYLSVVFVISGLFYAASLYNIKRASLLGFIAERGEDDTRTGVELYFYNDFEPKDWLFGRGINGEYYCPATLASGEVIDNRFYIETGYLQMILKGGIIELGLFLLITVPAAVLGILFSRNLLSKAAGIWIFILLFALYPATVNTFSLRYMLIWVCVGICYSKKIRNLPDYRIQEIFKTPYKLLE